MIKYHPSHELLDTFVTGQLPASFSAAIAIHTELCDICRNKVAQLESTHANNTFTSVADEDHYLTADMLFNDWEMDSLISAITDDTESIHATATTPQSVSFNDTAYQLPRALQHIVLGKQLHVGKLTRSRLDLNEGAIHVSLLHIQAGGCIPNHTHKGSELTLLLEGSFEDEMGTYNKGDFILLNSDHTHSPITKHGCLCYTVVDSPLTFTEGMAKILNPLGNFIY
ncbi:ChrR family anti-sigma-E factor [Moritella sp. Urea-trap-13]|uniref:ChrR family anti-sigma-E factor n=1 Tax=Moritella sp. Urea-trap-13 TaxID=2058327 RepID=UPI000C33E638|nr:ChrR family anti-sigma-E factor [Moritella sp. Urea-trap-13]PKH07138.1 transcriptional regulator [Moritella sp. Urea-trap-13]